MRMPVARANHFGVTADGSSPEEGHPRWHDSVEGSSLWHAGGVVRFAGELVGEHRAIEAEVITVAVLRFNGRRWLARAIHHGGSRRGPTWCQTSGTQGRTLAVAQGGGHRRAQGRHIEQNIDAREAEELGGMQACERKISQPRRCALERIRLRWAYVVGGRSLQCRQSMTVVVLRGG
jgi:hypothetical protein